MRQTIGQGIRQTGGATERFLKRLPPHVSAAFAAVEASVETWDEMHLRVGRYCSVTLSGETRRVPVTLTAAEMDALLHSLCEGSMYAHRADLAQGYVSVGDGIRVGVCGVAATDDGGTQLLGLRRVDTLCVRFSHPLRSLGRALIEDIRVTFPRGTLIYAPPGGGKTTLLRALATHLASGERPLRVALIDTRGELDDGCFDKELSLSVLSGYPKGQGIEIATRTQDAQLIVCDEIGANEAGALLSVANSGVPILASAHATSVEDVLHRPALRELCETAVFGLFVGIERRPRGGESYYHLTRWEEVGATVCG